MAGTIEIETNDSVEDVKASLGPNVEIEESTGEVTEEEQEEKPAAKPPKQAKAEPVEEPAETENEEEEPTEEEPEEEAEEKPKKSLTPTVPRARLTEETRKRRAAEQRLAELEAEAEPEAEEEAVEVAPPTVFIDRPKPKLKDFIAKVDKFDPDAVVAATQEYEDERDKWADDNAAAKARSELAQQRQQEQMEALTADFVERRDAFAEENEEYNDLVPNSKVMLSNYQQGFVWKSDVGPQILLYAVKHPKEMQRIAKTDIVTQSEKMLAIQAKLRTEYGIGETEDGEEPLQKKPASRPLQAPPPTKTTSKAPLPPSRLKPSGPGPRTERELAGPEDRVGVDLEFSPELEAMDKARRKT